MMQTEDEVRTKPGEKNNDTLLRWFKVCRVLEQVHTMRSIKYAARNDMGFFVVLVMNLVSALAVALPMRHVCGDGIYGDGLVPEEVKDFIVEFFAVLTILVAGLRQHWKYETLAERDRAAARAFKDLLLRFENLVQCGYPYMLADLAEQNDASMQQSLDAVSLTPKSPRTPSSKMPPLVTTLSSESVQGGALDREQFEREQEPRRTPSWKDWVEDFQRVMKTSPLIRHHEWDEAAIQIRKSLAYDNMKVNLERLANTTAGKRREAQDHEVQTQEPKSPKTWPHPEQSSARPEPSPTPPPRPPPTRLQPRLQPISFAPSASRIQVHQSSPALFADANKSNN